MQLRAVLRLIYQVGRVVIQTAALILDVDDLSGGRLISRVRIRDQVVPGISADRGKEKRRSFVARRRFKPMRHNKGPPR